MYSISWAWAFLVSESIKFNDKGEKEKETHGKYPVPVKKLRKCNVFWAVS